MKPSHQGRYPRTLQEAFGPYTNSDITEEEPPSAALVVYRFLGVLGGVILALHLLARWLA